MDQPIAPMSPARGWLLIDDHQKYGSGAPLEFPKSINGRETPPSWYEQSKQQSSQD